MLYVDISVIITAVINAYLEREKARQEEDRAMSIIREINDHVTVNSKAILDALFNIEVSRLTGFYLGLVENFKEYDLKEDEPTDSESTKIMKELLLKIAYDTNEEIIGPLINLFDSENEVTRLRQIVHLLVLTLSLRALVISELKFRHGDDRDDHLLEQWKYIGRCSTRVINEQISQQSKPKFDKWNNCEIEPHVGQVCLPLNDTDPWGMPTSCCSDEFYAYKPERDLLTQDHEQSKKVDEAITHLEGIILLNKWETIKINEKPKSKQTTSLKN
jgi:hypothetical protein